MKKIITLLFLIISLQVIAQERLITKNGIINFEASVPSFEEVKAKSNSYYSLVPVGI